MHGQKIEFPEMELDFVVPPDLDTCELKPYVSWRVKIPGEDTLTAEKLFQKKYANQIADMYDKKVSKSDIIQKIALNR